MLLIKSGILTCSVCMFMCVHTLDAFILELSSITSCILNNVHTDNQFYDYTD